MKTNTSLTSAISEISLDKDIDKDLIVQTIEKTIVDAAKKKYPQYSNIEAQFDDGADMIRLYYYKTVTKDVTDENNEISIGQAKEIDSEAQLDDEISYEIEEGDYGNIIAQTARQGFFQKINELENSLLIEKYTDQIGKIVHGTVGQVNKNRSVIHLKKNVSAILDSRDAIPFEKLTSGEAIKALLKEIDVKDSKKKFLKLSRNHPDFLLKLLKLEIPEVDDKTIEVLAVARDPGRRAKIAVKTNNPDVDPVGSCVGRGGERIQTVVNELNGERIDVIKWSDNLKQFIVDALVPAEIDHINLDTENNIADVFIDEQNLALAIGKRGQNVRLASQLTQFELNIRMLEDTKSESKESDDDVPEIQLFSDNSTQKAEEKTEEKAKHKLESAPVEKAPIPNKPDSESAPKEKISQKEETDTIESAAVTSAPIEETSLQNSKEDSPAEKAPIPNKPDSESAPKEKISQKEETDTIESAAVTSAPIEETSLQNSKENSPAENATQ